MNRQTDLQRVGDRLPLPPLPDIVARVHALLDDPQAVAPVGGAVSAEEQAVTDKVLGIANTPHFGLQSPVTTLEEAAAAMGVRSLRNIALQVSLAARFTHLATDFEYDVAGSARHAAFVGELCQALALRLPTPPELDPEELFTCGLLHDVGKLVMLEALSDDYYAVYLEASRDHRPIHLVEQHALGFTHADVGAAVLAHWNLPEAMGQAIHYHHGPRDELFDRPAAAVLALADQVGYRLGTKTWDKAAPRLTLLADMALGLNAQDFRGFLEYAQSMRTQVAV